MKDTNIKRKRMDKQEEKRKEFEQFIKRVS